MREIYSYEIAKKSDELKKLILENPDLPIVVLAGQDATTGCHAWTFCSYIGFRLGEILDCDYCDYDDTVFTDRDRLEEYVMDELCDQYDEATDEELNMLLKDRLAVLEPYWKKVIAIYADN